MMLRFLRPLSFFALCLFLFSSCKDDKSFTVVGNISGMPPQRARLQELTIKDTIIISDSAVISADGKFELEAKADHPGIYQLIFEQGKYILLSADGANINITGSWAQLSDATITGSPATVSLARFLKVIEEHLRDVRTMGIVLDTLKQQGKDSMMNRAMADARGIQERLTRYVEQYADTTKYLPNALFAVRVLNPATEQQYLSIFTQGLVNRFPNQPQASEFITRYNQMAAAQQGQQPDQAFTGQPVGGAAAPEISAATPDGKTVALSSFRGKYVLLDFWASWCGPCRAENPNVVAAFNKYKGKNFDILSVSLDDDKDSWKAAIGKDKLAWTHISDLQRWESVPARIYNVQGIPANFLIDPAGKIIGQNLRGADLDAKLAEVLQ